MTKIHKGDEETASLSPTVVKKDIQLKADQWQPIETAPKGSKVLVAYQNELGKWRRVCARYYEPGTLESELAWDGWSEPGWYEACEATETIYQVEREPTHWMPLPAPPISQPTASASAPTTTVTDKGSVQGN